MPCLAAKNQRNHHNTPQCPQLKNPPNQVTTKVPCLATHPAHRLRPKRPLQRPKLHQRPKLQPKNRPPRPKTATTQAARRMILMLKWTVDPTQISRHHLHQRPKRPNQQLLRKNCKILEVSVTTKTVSGPNLQPKRPKKRANQPNLRPLQKPKLHQRPKLRPKRPKRPLTVT